MAKGGKRVRSDRAAATPVTHIATGVTEAVWVSKAALDAKSPTVTGTSPLRSNPNHR